MKREAAQEEAEQAVQWLSLPNELWHCILQMAGKYCTLIVFPSLSGQCASIVRQTVQSLTNRWSLCDWMIERVPNVRALSLRAAPECYLSMPSLARLTGLTSLSLTNKLPYFAKYIMSSLINLTHLDLYDNDTPLPKAPKLRSLRLKHYYRLTLEELSQLTCLEKLVLKASRSQCLS